MQTNLTQKLDHSFDLDWAKRGGVIYCTGLTGRYLFGYSRHGLYGLAIMYDDRKAWISMIPNQTLDNISYITVAPIDEIPDARMATPEECDAAGVEYIERPVVVDQRDFGVEVDSKDAEKVGG